MSNNFWTTREARAAGREIVDFSSVDNTVPIQRNLWVFQVFIVLEVSHYVDDTIGNIVGVIIIVSRR